jgi:hypothetical protein
MERGVALGLIPTPHHAVAPPVRLFVKKILRPLPVPSHACYYLLKTDVHPGQALLHNQ